MSEGIDFEAEGLLEGLDGEGKEARRELLEQLTADGVSLEELKRAVAEDRLALLPVELVLAGDGRYSARDVARLAGLDPAFQERQMRALGLTVGDPEERIFGEEDVEAARAVKLFLDAGIPEEGVLEVCRVMGDSMAKLAAAIGGVVGPVLLRPGDTERDLGLRYAETLRQLGPLAAPTLQQMLNLRLREVTRQAVIGQAELQSGRLPGSQPISVAFVDIVGFTRLGEETPPDDLGAVVRRFELAVNDAVEEPVRLVKTIGDAAMLVSPEPGPLVETVLGLVERSQAEGPLLRGGIASGEGLSRAGDWYGRPVNLASRLTSFARRGSVVTSEEVREAAGDGWDWSKAGSRRFKGVRGSVDVYRVRREGAGGD